MMVALDGSSPEPIENSAISGPTSVSTWGDLSSNGNVYVASEYGQRSQKHEVWLYNRKEQTRQFIAYGYWPVVSVDGKRIFFVSPDGNRDVVRASADATEIIHVFTGARNKTELRRSVDGNSVVFGVWNESNETTELYMLDIGTSKVTKVYDL